MPTGFRQNVGYDQVTITQRQKVITKLGRPDIDLLSLTMYDVLIRGRIARSVEALDDDTLTAIARAEVSSARAEFDHLLKDWMP